MGSYFPRKKFATNAGTIATAIEQHEYRKMAADAQIFFKGLVSISAWVAIFLERSLPRMHELLRPPLNNMDTEKMAADAQIFLKGLVLVCAWVAIFLERSLPRMHELLRPSLNSQEIQKKWPQMRRFS